MTQKTMRLSYTATTSLNLALQTISGQDVQIDWGDGVWVTYTSSTTARTKTFATPTSGVARVRSAVGNPKSDIHYIESTDGTWNFDIAALSNVTYWVYFNGSSMTLTGDIAALSNVTYLVRFSGSSMTLTGDIADLSNVTYWVYFNGNSMTLTGDIADLSNVTYLVYFIGNSMTLTGDIAALSNVTYSVYFNGSSMTLTGDIADLSNVTYLVRFSGSSMTLTYTTTTWTTIPSNTFYLRLASGHLTSTEVDTLLIDFNAAGTSGSATIDLRGSNGAPTSASAAAILGLQSRGYIVLTN